MITIFGESAGGSSVAAQMMGQHNTGLFQRGIAQVQLTKLLYTNPLISTQIELTLVGDPDLHP